MPSAFLRHPPPSHSHSHSRSRSSTHSSSPPPSSPPGIQLNSTLSPLDALASQTRKLSFKRLNAPSPSPVHDQLPSLTYPPSPLSPSTFPSQSPFPGSNSNSTSVSYTETRPSTRSLIISDQADRATPPRSRSPLLSPDFTDARLAAQLGLDRHLQSSATRDSVASFATASTDYVWDHHEEDDDDPPGGAFDYVRGPLPPNPIRRPSTGTVTTSQVRAERSRDHINSIYGDHQVVDHHPLPSSNYLYSHSGPCVEQDEGDPLEVLGRSSHPTRNHDERQTWMSTTSAQTAGSDTDSDTGWESTRYASGYSVSSEDPFQYSHYESPRPPIGTANALHRPGLPFATFPTRLPSTATVTLTTHAQSGHVNSNIPTRTAPPELTPSAGTESFARVLPGSTAGSVRNFSRPLRPSSAGPGATDLPTPPPSRDRSPSDRYLPDSQYRVRASTTTSRSSMETTSSGTTHKSFKGLFAKQVSAAGHADSREESSAHSFRHDYHQPNAPVITFSQPTHSGPHTSFQPHAQPPAHHHLPGASKQDVAYHGEHFEQPLHQAPHIRFAPVETTYSSVETSKAKGHRLSIYSLPPNDSSAAELEAEAARKQRYMSRSPVSIAEYSAGSRSPRPIDSRPSSPVPSPSQARRASQLPSAMAKAKASLAANRAGGGGGGANRTAQDYLQLGIEAHERGEMERSAGLFERSAREAGGCGAGMLMWGLALRHGWGCQVNEGRAFKWLQKAAESVVEDVEKVATGKEEAHAMKNELVLAIYELGQCFMRGWGCKKDKALAISYFELAAKLGDPDAQQELGFCYANGKGTKKDLKKAAKYYRMASKQGIEMMGAQWIWKSKYD